MVFLKEIMSKMEFDSVYITWIWALYMNAWCLVGLNGIITKSFELFCSIRQECLLVSFLHSFIIDFLSYLLENDESV